MTLRVVSLEGLTGKNLEPKTKVRFLFSKGHSRKTNAVIDGLTFGWFWNQLKFKSTFILSLAMFWHSNDTAQQKVDLPLPNIVLNNYFLAFNFQHKILHVLQVAPSSLVKPSNTCFNFQYMIWVTLLATRKVSLVAAARSFRGRFLPLWST